MGDPLAPPRHPLAPPRAFAVAVAGSAAALALSALTVRIFGGAYLYLPLVAVFVSALAGGLWPGLATVALCALGFDFLFLGPPLRFGVSTSEEAHRLAGFVLFGAAASWIAARFQAARAAAERARAEAEAASAETRRIGALQERLVAIVSHDLRNPLAALRGGLDLLPRVGPLSDRHAALLARMRGTVDRMEALIRDLLDVSRTRHGGRLPLTTIPARVGEVCAQAIAEIRAADPDARVELAVEGDDAARVDAPHLARLVTNLVANALVHGDHGAPVRVTVRGAAAELALEVENRGPPPPPDLVPRMFEAFQRGGDAGEGLGLGLFVVREVARAHGGSVSVRAGAEATVFEVRLPRSAP
jgi:signal transduction histidine kinase